MINGRQESVLVVDDEPVLLSAMVESLEHLDVTVIAASDGDEAWRRFESEKPDIVVTDVRMPNRDGIQLTKQIKSMRPACPVIVVTGFGSENAAISALKAGASDFLVKPFPLSDLRQSVDRVCSLVRAQWADDCVAPIVERLETTLVIDNLPEMISGAVNLVMRSLVGLCPDDQRLRVRVVLQELLLNAIEHGNLGISSEEKRQALEECEYDRLLDERRAEPNIASRRTRVALSHDVVQGQVTIGITDEGEGFDWSAHVGRDANELPAAAGSGRGIFLVKTLLPEVTYHGNGNEVRIVLTHAPGKP